MYGRGVVHLSRRRRLSHSRWQRRGDDEPVLFACRVAADLDSRALPHQVGQHGGRRATAQAARRGRRLAARARTHSARRTLALRSRVGRSVHHARVHAERALDRRDDDEANSHGRFVVSRARRPDRLGAARRRGHSLASWYMGDGRRGSHANHAAALEPRAQLSEVHNRARATPITTTIISQRRRGAGRWEIRIRI